MALFGYCGGMNMVGTKFVKVKSEPSESKTAIGKHPH